MRTFRLLALVLPLPAIAIATYACGNGGDDSSNNNAPDSSATTTPPSGDSDALASSDGSSDSGAPPVAACGDYNALKRPLFGDLHQHTSYSADAYTFDTRNTPIDAYAFARGKTLQVAGAGPNGGGPMTTIDRPLDFLAVTDHSEFLAAAYGCGTDLAGNPYDSTKTIFDTKACKAFRSNNQALGILGIFGVIRNVCDSGQCEPVITTAWQKEQQAAAAAYEPCKFTSFVAYEWTKMINGATLHKNVIFATDKVPARPFDSLTYATQEELWNALATGCNDPQKGCEAVTIPHNSNISQGMAFEVPTGAADRANMIRFQKLVEIFQHKGGSECLSADNSDPDCTFEQLPDAVDVARDQSGYVRDGLKKGLLLQSTSSTGKDNPLAFGIIGATDDHNGTPANVKESTFVGHVGSNDDSPQKRIRSDAGEVSAFNPGGITVAWAEENTRASLFAAFQRRETYATSGPRMVVRFYEAANNADAVASCADPNFPKGLVDKGAIPMGGAFQAPASSAPAFVVRAWKDATSLARIDIIKAWVDGTGAVKEKVIAKPLDASQSASACVTWKDEEPTAGPALYYARVLEAPTPRWSSYDCDKAPLINPQACAAGGSLRKNIQERAWTSPIWRSP